MVGGFCSSRLYYIYCTIGLVAAVAVSVVRQTHGSSSPRSTSEICGLHTHSLIDISLSSECQ